MRRLSIMLATAAGLAISASGALADTTLKLVEVITSPQRTEFLKKQIAEFEAANAGVKVEVVSLPWGQAFEKFLTMVQAGDTPDIVEMPERWMGLYATNGQLEGGVGQRAAGGNCQAGSGGKHDAQSFHVQNSHFEPSYFFALSKAWAMSAQRSSTLSNPTLKRMVRGLTPKRAIEFKPGVCSSEAFAGTTRLS